MFSVFKIVYEFHELLRTVYILQFFNNSCGVQIYLQHNMEYYIIHFCNLTNNRYFQEIEAFIILLKMLDGVEERSSKNKVIDHTDMTEELKAVEDSLLKRLKAKLFI